MKKSGEHFNPNTSDQGSTKLEFCASAQTRRRAGICIPNAAYSLCGLGKMSVAGDATKGDFVPQRF